MQGLLNSFCKGTPEGSTSGSYSIPMFGKINPSNGYYYNDIDSLKDATLEVESPTRIGVDESGYESFESSAYDVASEDEEENNNNKFFDSVEEDVGKNEAK